MAKLYYYKVPIYSQGRKIICYKTAVLITILHDIIKASFLNALL